MNMWYVEKDGVPVESHSPSDSWWETADRKVGLTQISPDIEISTVFLGLKHQFRDGPPLLYETMVFRGGQGDECERYSTREEALAGHEAMCERVRQAERRGTREEE